MTRAAELQTELRASLHRAVVGQDQVIDGLIYALLCGGHVLLEGVPGTAKTLMARSLAASLDAKFVRIQFTPDLLPSDILGTAVFLPQKGEFEFRPGPIFGDTILADEINRAPAKTQAALLEAMEERQVTTEGTRYPLGGMFTVIATQNPIEFEGTYPLPEAQLDRFFFKLEVSLPPAEVEGAILRHIDSGFDALNLSAAGLKPVVVSADLDAAREEVARVKVADNVMDYIVQLATATRNSPEILFGASPRGSIALLKGAKAIAACSGRDYVIPEDARDIAVPVLRHRLVRRPEAEVQGVSEVDAVERAISRVPVPR